MLIFEACLKHISTLKEKNEKLKELWLVMKTFVPPKINYSTFHGNLLLRISLLGYSAMHTNKFIDTHKSDDENIKDELPFYRH
jgi:hypothetical protein